MEVCRKIVGPHRSAARPAATSTRERVRRAPLLHQDRRQPGVGGAGARAAPRSPSGHTRGSRSSTLVSRSSGRRPVGGGRPALADQEPQHVGVALGVAAAGADADPRRWSSAAAGPTPWPAWSAARRRSACTARSPGRPGPAYDGTPRSSSATAGGGTGRVPCAPRTVPEPTATGETTTSSAPRCDEAGAHPDDVGDRVERADLVEVHVERVVAVHGGLGDGEPLEDRAAPGRAPRRRVGAERAGRGCRARCGGARSRRPRRGSGWRRSRCG